MSFVFRDPNLGPAQLQGVQDMFERTRLPQFAGQRTVGGQAEHKHDKIMSRQQSWINDFQPPLFTRSLEWYKQIIQRKNGQLEQLCRHSFQLFASHRLSRKHDALPRFLTNDSIDRCHVTWRGVWATAKPTLNTNRTDN